MCQLVTIRFASPQFLLHSLTFRPELRATVPRVRRCALLCGDAGNSSATEAPAGFDNLTNGMTPQGPSFQSLTEDNVVPLRSFNDSRFVFEEVETIADGLGPVYNAQSCRECHQNVVTGGASQIV